MEIADSLGLRLSISINQVLTWYADNLNSSNSVINLMFLQDNSTEIDNHLSYQIYEVLWIMLP